MSPILGVAIKYKGQIYTAPKPARHNDVIRLIHDATGDMDIQGEQGFYTARHPFVDRDYATTIAIRARQITERPPHGLYSEHLW